MYNTFESWVIPATASKYEIEKGSKHIDTFETLY